MARRIRVRRTAPSISTEDQLRYKGDTYTVGETLKVKPNGSGFWKEAVLKKIGFDRDGNPVLTFYVDSPGWITVGMDQIKRPKAKGRKRKRVIED